MKRIVTLGDLADSKETGDLWGRAKDAVRDAFEPQEFAARPTYGIGYIPAGDEPPVGPPGNFASWADTRLAWAAFFAALALAVGVDLYVLNKRGTKP